MTGTPSPTTETPEALAGTVSEAASGDAGAFAVLYGRHARSVYNLVYRSVRDAEAAQDVCQDVWIKAYRDLPTLREPAAFSTWVYRIASRACIDRARKFAKERPVALVDVHEAPASDEPEEMAILREREGLAWEALAVLPERQHLALFLREVEGQRYRDIAEILETSESAVETLLYRARRGLSEAFDRLQAATSERCGQARQSMAVVLDGEATPVQQRAVDAHVDSCGDCRQELTQLQRGSVAYGAVPFLPVPALLGERVLEGIGAGAAAASAGATAGSSGGLLPSWFALAAAKAKLLTTAGVLTGGLAVAAVVTPADHSLGSATVLQGDSDPVPVVSTGRPADESDNGVPAADEPEAPLDEATATAIASVQEALQLLELLNTGNVPVVSSALDGLTTRLDDALDGAAPPLPPVNSAPTVELPVEGPPLPDLPLDDVDAPLPDAPAARPTLSQSELPPVPSAPPVPTLGAVPTVGPPVLP